MKIKQFISDVNDSYYWSCHGYANDRMMIKNGWTKDQEGQIIEAHHRFFDPVHFVLDSLEAWTCRLECFMRGHQWEDTSTAGPESGDVACECTHCGYGFRHILY